MRDESTYPVVEIFASLQGEGYNTGKEVVFLRFGGCNLACPWCDTECDAYARLDADAIVAKVSCLGFRSLILTGGEPFIQDGLGDLMLRFKDLGFWIGVETNGVVAPPHAWSRLINYVSVSPKALYEELYDDERMLKRADEVRIVVDGDVEGFCERMRNRIEASHYFLSPCERDGMFNIEETVRLLGKLNDLRQRGKWMLSLQAHKLAHFR